jgi:hypothetical protein
MTDALVFTEHAALSTAVEALESVAAEFDVVLLAGPGDEDGAAGDPETPDELESAAATLEEEFTAVIGAVDRLTNNAQSATESAEGLLKFSQGDGVGWTEPLHEQHDALGNLDEVVRAQATEMLSEHLASVRSTIESLTETLADRLGDLGERGEALAQLLSESSPEHIREAVAGFIETLGTQVHHPLATLLDDSQAEVEGRLHDLRDTTVTLVAETGQEISGLFQEAVRKVTDDAGLSLERAGEQLVERAARRLGEAIAEAVVQSGTAAALSGTLTPALPTMLSLKHGADALIDLIEIWKNAQLDL